jgi:hypothetical protein
MHDSSSHQSAEELFKIIDETILKKSYSKNLISFTTDGAHSLRGKKNSVLSRLKEVKSSLWDFYDMSHCYNRASCFAANAIPENVETLVKNIYNFFAISSKRSDKWKEFQRYMNLKPHKMLKYIDTRWLSLEQCVERILERKKELRQFLKDYNEKNSSRTRNKILKDLDDPETQIYLQFLAVFLERVNTLNKYFQQQDSCVTEIIPRSREFLIIMINLILKSEYRKLSIEEKLKFVTYDKETKLCNIDDSYFRSEVDFYTNMKSIYGKNIQFEILNDKESQAKISRNLIQFILRLLWKLKEKLPLQDQNLDRISTLNPQMVL